MPHVKKLLSVCTAVAAVVIAVPAPARAADTPTVTSTTVPSTSAPNWDGTFTNSVPEQPWWQVPPTKPASPVTPRAKALPTPRAKPIDRPAPAPKPRPISVVWVLSGDILFTSGSAVLSVAADSQLVGLVDQASLHPGCRITITGYTDDVPDPTFPGGNLGLSVARAKSVARYLVEAGLGGDLITAKGYGAADPVGDNGTDQGRQLNRRVVIRMTNG